MRRVTRHGTKENSRAVFLFTCLSALNAAPGYIFVIRDRKEKTPGVFFFTLPSAPNTAPGYILVIRDLKEIPRECFFLSLHLKTSARGILNILNHFMGSFTQGRYAWLVPKMRYIEHGMPLIPDLVN
jgi:hypothetical protein